jgi:hypothetical protein
MPKKQDSLNADLARQLARYKPVARASSGDKVPVPEEADVFQFKFTLDGEDYGTVSVSIDGLHKLVVYDNEDVQHSPKYSKNKDLTWEQLSPYAEYVKTDRQENTRNKNFQKATKRIVEWERHLSIFDFISKGDMILTSEEDDDED